MRTSLNEIKLIDDHLFNTGTTEDELLFDAMLILNPALQSQVMWQKKSHFIVQQYSRKKLRAEIKAAHQKLFNENRYKTFRNRIMHFFDSV